MPVIKIEDKSFDQLVIKSKKPILVDFWGSWCPPCKAIEPLVEKLSEQYLETVTFGKLNVDLNPKVAASYKILGLPTFIVFWKGEEINRAIASLSEKQLKKLIDEALKKIQS